MNSVYGLILFYLLVSYINHKYCCLMVGCLPSFKLMIPAASSQNDVACLYFQNIIIQAFFPEISLFTWHNREKKWLFKVVPLQTIIIRAIGLFLFIPDLYSLWAFLKDWIIQKTSKILCLLYLSNSMCGAMIEQFCACIVQPSEDVVCFCCCLFKDRDIHVYTLTVISTGIFQNSLIIHQWNILSGH